jgi:hypothetical protein
MALQRLALRKFEPNTGDLLGAQLPCGAWSNRPVTAIPNAYTTGLALIALANNPWAPEVRSAVERAFSWLERTRGREGHWLWQWKFRLFDRQVRFDPSKFGWPWVENTVSWVAPTSIALLAYKAWNRPSERVPSALAMLEDRACSAGGWNAGNGHAFGVDLDPHPDFSAMALCALGAHGAGESSLVEKTAQFLDRRLEGCGSAYSVAWSVLALRRSSGRRLGTLVESLRRISEHNAATLNTSALALTALALESPAFDLGTRA